LDWNNPSPHQESGMASLPEKKKKVELPYAWIIANNHPVQPNEGESFPNGVVLGFLLS
jgi:hypothetical protein